VLTSNGVSAPTWQNIPGTGTVTSINVSGGTTGLTTSGGPVTASGTITLAGTLALANGGTGATTASAARTALGLGTIATQDASAVTITGGTINGSHISLEVDGSGSISGAGNALRATLGGTQTAQTGTLGVIQLDTNYTGSVTTPSNSAFIRVTDSGSATGKINNLMSIGAGPTATLVSSGAATPGGTIKKIKIDISGVTYYVLAATTWS
jgi:hypothetical protein